MEIAPSRVTAQLGEGYCAFSNGSTRRMKAKDPMEAELLPGCQWLVVTGILVGGASQCITFFELQYVSRNSNSKSKHKFFCKLL